MRIHPERVTGCYGNMSARTCQKQCVASLPSLNVHHSIFEELIHSQPPHFKKFITQPTSKNVITFGGERLVKLMKKYMFSGSLHTHM